MSLWGGHNPRPHLTLSDGGASVPRQGDPAEIASKSASSCRESCVSTREGSAGERRLTLLAGRGGGGEEEEVSRLLRSPHPATRLVPATMAPQVVAPSSEFDWPKVSLRALSVLSSLLPTPTSSATATPSTTAVGNCRGARAAQQSEDSELTSLPGLLSRSSPSTSTRPRATSSTCGRTAAGASRSGPTRPTSTCTVRPSARSSPKQAPS